MSEEIKTKSRKRKAATVEKESDEQMVLTPLPEVKIRKTDGIVLNFKQSLLPQLKKEMDSFKKKKEDFNLEAYAAFFAPNSGTVATYILPLFRFLGKNTITCSRYGLFDTKHCVKTTEGFDRVLVLSNSADPADFTPDIQAFCAARYGKEWFKIPAKDGYKAKAACSGGHDKMFKVILTGVFFDSFIDSTTNEEVQTINPVLQYEPMAAPPPKKERKTIVAKKVKSKKLDSPPPPKEEEGEDSEDEINPDSAAENIIK